VLFTLLAALTLPVLAFMPEHIDTPAVKDVAKYIDKDADLKPVNNRDTKVGSDVDAEVDTFAEMSAGLKASKNLDTESERCLDNLLDLERPVDIDLNTGNEVCSDIDDVRNPYKKDKDS
jgi:hypothetical protein